MDLVQLQYFKTLAEHEHMTQAANELHIAQPALSRMLRNLEKELGLLLFDRDGKSIRLNENGNILLYYIDNILREVEEAKNILADRKAGGERQVNLSMRAATSLLPDIIRGFRINNPDISIIITQHEASSLEMSDKCDIMIHSGMQPTVKKNSVNLAREEICLAMPLSHPLCSRGGVRLLEVAQAPFICLHKGSGLRTVTDAYCLRAGFQPKTVMESDSPSIVRDLIALGVGLAFIPKLTWAGFNYGSGISLVNIEDPRCVRYIYMTWRDNRYISSASKLFQKYLIEFFSGLKNRDYDDDSKLTISP